MQYIIMLSVLVQFWGQSRGVCNWVPLGIIENPPTLDYEFLRGKVNELVKSREIPLIANVARLNVMRDGKTEMKITMTDIDS